MKKFKRRSFGAGSKFEHPNNEEAPVLDLSKDVADNMKELLNEITKKEYMPTTKRMGYLNNFSQFVRSVPLTANFGLSLDEITACLRLPLIHPAKEVRAAGFRAFRHLLSDEDTLSIFLQQRIDIFISRCLDLPPSAEVERVQALRLIRKMVYLCPQTFPMSLAVSLAAISCDGSQDKDQMSRACLATLCELAVNNIKVAAYSGVIGAIVKNVLDCSIPVMNESLVCTILYFYNHPKFRGFVRRKVGLEGILAPLTDINYTHYSELQESMMREDRLNRIESAKQALVAIFRSWSGLVSLCDPEKNNMESIIDVFKVSNMEIRKAIIDALYEIFCLRPPKMTDDYNEALCSVDPSAMQDNWELSEEFLLAEADAVLVHRAQSTRANLVENYLSLILCAFIDAGILDSLVQVTTTSDDFICIRGSILIGELLHMANFLVPPNISGQTHCLSTLMSMATSYEKTPEERGKASAVVGYLDQLHRLKKRGSVPNSLFMKHLITQATSDVGQSSKSKSNQEKTNVSNALKDMDEILNAIRETHVLLTQEKEFISWNWDYISTILESSKMSLKRPDEPLFYRFIKRLTLFYKPFQQLYSTVKQTDKMARKYSSVALQLIDFLLRKEEQPDGERILIEVLQEIRDILGEATQAGMITGYFSIQSLSETVSRNYFLIIGRLSSSTTGLRILEKTSGIIQYLMDICSMSSRDSMIKLIISSFDYGRNGIARVLLSKALTSSPATSRLYATKFLRVLLRVKTPYFSNWGMQFLTNQLYDQDSEVVEAAIDILEEACEDEANLQRLIEVQPSLVHLGDQGIRLLSRYVSVSKGFCYLQEMQYLQLLVDGWKNNYSREYVNWIELELAASLSLYERHGTDGTYIRRSGSKFVARRDVYVLPHLYGELARHISGIELIKQQNLFEDPVNIIRLQNMETSHEIFQMKSALWAVGHITSTSLGINLIGRSKRPSQLSVPFGSFTETVMSDSFDTEDLLNDDIDEPNVMEIIVDMAMNCEVLTLRGTAFYVLSLMASTATGADLLEDYGWESVRHKGDVMWPIIEQDITIFFEPDWYAEEQVSEIMDESDFPPAEQQQNQTQERFGGIYMGEDLEDDMQPPLSFDYSFQRYGVDKKKKRAKAPTSDDTRYLQMMSAKLEDDSEQTNLTMKFYDINSLGYKYEKEESLIEGLKRMTESGDIYVGEDDGSSIRLSESVPPKYSLEHPAIIDLAEYSFEDCMPFLAGIKKEIPIVEELPKKGLVKTKAIFDAAGIYLGEEESEDAENHDAIEGNLSVVSASQFLPDIPVNTTVRQERDIPKTEGPRAPSTDANSQLKPIREEKSQESLNSKTDLANTVVEAEITDDLRSIRKLSNIDSSNDTSTLNSSCVSDERTPTRSPVRVAVDKIEPRRHRSVSLNDALKTQIERSSRSSSFSGTAAHSKLVANDHTRSDSDPGFTHIVMGSSTSSQESDIMRNDIAARNSYTQNTRKKSRSENEDERNRSSSIISDSSANGKRLRLAKRLRGGSTLSLGVSPKSHRGISLATPLESSYSSSYSRDGSYGYTAWQTLKKQRSFKKELESTLRKHSGAVSDKRKSHRSLAHQYRRLLETSSRWTSGNPSGTACFYLRRHISSTSSSGPTELSDVFPGYSGGSIEVYVGRCLPSLNILPELFRVKPYSYVGSRADNFDEFSSEHNLHEHLKEKCLACRIRMSRESWSESESDISLHSKSRSGSKEDDDGLVTDEDAEGSDCDENTSKQKKKVFGEVLKLVFNLSSAVASKVTQQEIISLRVRTPWAFQDLCLYSQVMELLGIYTFRLSIRRFIQALFEGVDFALVVEHADIILGRQPSQPSNAGNSSTKNIFK